MYVKLENRHDSKFNLKTYNQLIACVRESQLPAHYFGFFCTKVIITNRSPLSTVTHLHSPLILIRASHQSNGTLGASQCYAKVKKLPIAKNFKANLYTIYPIFMPVQRMCTESVIQNKTIKLSSYTCNDIICNQLWGKWKILYIV